METLQKISLHQSLRHNSDGNWLVPPAHSEQQVSVQAFLSTVILSETEDYYEWTIEGTQMGKFFTNLRARFRNRINKLRSSQLLLLSQANGDK